MHNKVLGSDLASQFLNYKNILASDMAEISLVVEGHVFKVSKDVLCDKCDYFRAMFSGNYVESDKQEIIIDGFDVESMRIIIQYMYTGYSGLTHPTEYTVPTIGKLAIAANFLNLTGLIEEIEYTLQSIEILPENCMEIINITQNSELPQSKVLSEIEQRAVEYAVLSFDSMKPEYIPNIVRLCWYLSHPYLNASKEVDVFGYGYMWAMQNETGDDMLLKILRCLDITKFTLSDWSYITEWLGMLHYKDSLAAKMVYRLHELAELGMDLCVESVEVMRGEYSNRIYKELSDLIKGNRKRLQKNTPVMLAKNDSKFEFYTFTKKGFEMWLSYPDLPVSESYQDIQNKHGILISNIFKSNPIVVPWGSMKLVVLDRNKGCLMVHNVLNKQWTTHVKVQGQDCGGAAVVGNLIYLIAKSSGRYDFTTAIYDLKKQAFIKTSDEGDPSKRPTFGAAGAEMRARLEVCVHEGSVYAVSYGSIYEYTDLDTDSWKLVLKTVFPVTNMVSYKGYIYCTDRQNLHRFRPGTDNGLKRMTQLAYVPTAVCNLGNRLMFFSNSSYNITRHWFARESQVHVEDYNGNSPNERPRLLSTVKVNNIKVREIMGCCPLAMAIPPCHDISDYTKKYLEKYGSLE